MPGYFSPATARQQYIAFFFRLLFFVYLPDLDLLFSPFPAYHPDLDLLFFHAFGLRSGVVRLLSDWFNKLSQSTIEFIFIIIKLTTFDKLLRKIFLRKLSNYER